MARWILVSVVCALPWAALMAALSLIAGPWLVTVSTLGGLLIGGVAPLFFFDWIVGDRR